MNRVSLYSVTAMIGTSANCGHTHSNPISPAQMTASSYRFRRKRPHVISYVFMPVLRLIDEIKAAQASPSPGSRTRN